MTTEAIVLMTKVAQLYADVFCFIQIYIISSIRSSSTVDLFMSTKFVIIIALNLIIPQGNSIFAHVSTQTIHINIRLFARIIECGCGRFSSMSFNLNHVS